MPQFLKAQTNTNYTYTYDHLNRLEQVLYDNGTTIKYNYDKLGNRTCYKVTGNSNDQADLTPNNGILSINTIGAGSSAVLTFNSENIGTAIAGASSSLIVLSTNPNYEAGTDNILNTIYTPSIAAGGIATISEDISIPSATITGNYYLLIILDADGIITELSEFNNIIAVPVTISNCANLAVNVTITAATCSQSNGSATASATGGAGNYTYTWSTIPTQTGTTISNLSTGTYTVTVEDGNGCQDTAPFSITSTGTLPTANFSYTTNELMVNFNNTSNNGTSYNWDFGDTNSSTLSNPTHTYNVGGAYTVCLNTTNTCGTTQYCQMITISNASCSIPSGLSVSGITTTTAQLGWNSVGGATNYTIRYRATGVTNWLPLITTTTPTHTLSNLMEGTSYEFQIATTCASGMSSYSNSFYFSTSTSTTTNTDDEFFTVFENANQALMGRDISTISDGGYIVTNVDAIARHDSNGEIIWIKQYKLGTEVLRFQQSIQTSDGGFIAVGEVNRGTHLDIVVLKIDIDGNKEWMRTYGDTIKHDYGRGILEDNDGNYALIGYTRGFDAVSADEVVIKINPQGNLLWAKRFGGNNFAVGFEIILAQNGDYLALGRRRQEIELNPGSTTTDVIDIWRIQTDATVSWMKSYRNNDYNDDFDAARLIEAPNGMLYMTGEFDNGSRRGMVMQFNSTGNLQWAKYFSGPNEDERLFSLGIDNTGAIIAIGETHVGLPHKEDVGLFKINTSGTLLASYALPSDEDQFSFGGMIDGDKAIFVGQTEDFDTDGQDNGFIACRKTDFSNDCHSAIFMATTGNIATLSNTLNFNGSISPTSTAHNITVTDLIVTRNYPCGSACNLTNEIQASATTICAGERIDFFYTGAGATTYEWKTGMAGNTFGTTSNANYTFSTAGTFDIYLTVTDEATCQEETSIQITVLPQPTGNLTTTAEQCNGQDGTATLSIQNGTNPYTISWSTGANQVTNINNLSAGNYSVLVADANNCSAESIPFTITNTSEGFDLFGTVTDISCNGLIDGEINTNTSGTVGALNYTWSNNATSSTISGLAAGDYSLTLSDEAGCEETKVFTVSEPAALTLAINSTDETYCGFDNGTANVIVTGGTPSFQYNWQDSQMTSTAISLSQGNYVVTVTDNNNCTATTTAVIACEELICEPVILRPISNQIMDNDCSDGSDQIAWDFEWTSCLYATKYHLYVRSVTNSIIILNNSNIVDTFANFSNVDIFDQAGPFEVKVKAFVNGSWKDWSSTVSFDLEPVDTDCPCTTIVTKTNDTGIGSLRAAIDCANNDPSKDTISFDLSGTAPFIFQPSTKLPALTDNGIIIDATTQTGYTIGDIIIDGTFMDAGVSGDDGIEIKANDIGIYGLHLKKFTPGDAIKIGYNTSGARIGNEAKGNIITESRTAIFFCCVGGSDIVIEGNYIGTNPAGADLGNTWDGVNLQRAGNSSIRKNTIAYNNRYGVILQIENGIHITQNEFYCNQTPISLNNANNNKLTPIIQAANDYTITGTSEAGDIIEVFSTSLACQNAACQGETYLGTTLTNANGDWTLMTTPIAIGTKLTATATDANANTSNFANCYTVQDVCADLEFLSTSIIQRTSTSLSFNYSFTNKGTGIANLDGPTSAEFDNVSIQTFVSNDNIYGNADDLPSGGSIIDLSPIGNLSPNQNYDGNYTTYKDIDSFNYLIILVDWGDVILECDETNNVYILPLNEDACDGISLVLNQQPIEDGTYQAEESITSTAFVQPGGNVIFEAGEYILLEPGFETVANSFFEAIIKDCSDTVPLQQQQVTAKIIKEPSEDSKLLSLEVTPNPFYESTKIQYNLPKPTIFSLDLFDLNGRLIRPLVTQFQEVGNYEFLLKKTNLENGFYIVQLKTDTNIISKKIILIE